MAGNGPDFFKCSSSGTTITNVTIGAATQSQSVANSKGHIAGNVSPLYGIDSERNRNEGPDVTMKHLSAVVAIKVVNKTNGPIVVRDVEFGVPEVKNDKGAITQEAMPIVGDCNVEIVNKDNITVAAATAKPDGDKTFSSTKVTLVDEQNKPCSVTLSNPGDFITFYMNVRPFSATKTISIKVNSSERTKSQAISLTPGTITTFSVPVTPLVAENIATENGVIISDAFSVPSIGRTTNGDQSHITGNTYTKPDGTTISSTVISTTGIKKTIKVNGQDVEAYFLEGREDENGEFVPGTITITGFFQDLINALPIRFFVSGVDGEPAAMTVNQVLVHVPQYEYTEKEYSLLGTGYFEINTNFATINKRAGMTGLVGVALGGIGNPVTLTQELMLSLGDSVKEKITFTNIAKNGYFSTDNAIVLNEGFTQKEINETNIGNFLSPFTYNGKTATFKGLQEIANAPMNVLPPSSKVNQWRALTVVVKNDVKTAWPSNELKSKYPNLVNTIDAMYGYLMSKELMGMKIGGIVFSSPHAMLHMMRDAKIEVQLTTLPEAPRVVFWGLDAYTAADRAADAASNAGSQE